MPTQQKTHVNYTKRASSSWQRNNKRKITTQDEHFLLSSGHFLTN